MEATFQCVECKQPLTQREADQSVTTHKNIYCGSCQNTSKPAGLRYPESQQAFQEMRNQHANPPPPQPQRYQLSAPFIGMISNQVNMRMLDIPLDPAQWNKTFDELLELNLKKNKQLGL